MDLIRAQCLVSVSHSLTQTFAALQAAVGELAGDGEAGTEVGLRRGGFPAPLGRLLANAHAMQPTRLRQLDN